MPQQRLYYEYVDNRLIPYWYALSFRPCELKWDRSAYYFDTIKPFEFLKRDEFDESLAGISIFFSDFIFNVNYPGRIGMNLTNIKNRVERYGIDPQVIQQFVLSTPDLNDFLPLLPKKRQMDLVLG